MYTVPPPSGTSDLLDARSHLSPAHHMMLDYLHRRSTPMTIAQIAEDQNLHQNSVRESIDALFAAGLIQRAKLDSSGRGRPAWGYYSVAPKNDAVAGAYIAKFMRAVADMFHATASDPEATARALGVNWASALDGLIAAEVAHRLPTGVTYHQIDGEQRLEVLRNLLSTAGYAATYKPNDQCTLRLHACPFLDTDGTVDPLICEIHRGQVRLLVQRVSGGEEQGVLRPRVRPGVCEMSIVHQDDAQDSVF